MSDNDSDLFEAFKRLDKLCRESLQAEHGVTAYIDTMKEVPRYESNLIYDWYDDLRMLKRCRHIRNQLAHDNVLSYETLCNTEDVQFLHEFYNRMLNGDDPLAKLHRNRHRNHTRENRRSVATPSNTKSTQFRPLLSQEPIRRGCLACIIWILLPILSISVMTTLYQFFIK